MALRMAGRQRHRSAAPRIQEQKALCFVFRALSHALASHASKPCLIREMLLERKTYGPWDSDKREDVALVPLLKASPSKPFTLHTSP